MKHLLPGNKRSARETAAAYVMTRSRGRLSEVEERRFQDWLDEDRSHLQAYQDVMRVLSLTSDSAAHSSIMEMRSAALVATGQAQRNWGRVAAFGLLIAGGVAFTEMPHRLQFLPPETPIAQVIGAPPAAPTKKIYATLVGERVKLTLPDGSQATLDTSSRLRVAYSSKERAVALLDGQALFDVAKHHTLPFRVYAGGRRITALGTKFNVRVRPRQMQVALIEGVVRVTRMPVTSSRNIPSDAITMAAGELLNANDGAPIHVSGVDTNRFSSWESGLLMFRDDPLDAAVAELNRYTKNQIILADPEIATYRVTGVFQTARPQQFADAMSDAFPLTATMTDSGDIMLRLRRD